MNANPKKKLCWNCEGSAPHEVEHCPYCGVYLNPPLSESESKGSLFSPPYTFTVPETHREVPEAPYKANRDNAVVGAAKTPLSDSEIEEEAKNETGQFKQVITTLLCLLSGSVFFLFGIALLFFSQHGVFTLHWNGNYWFLYLLSGSPLLFFGWIALKQMQD